jgi:uncharacterized membrane protein
LAGLFFVVAFCLYGTALSLRHAWFQTSAWDLAIFDQAVTLIGQGLPAQSSLLGYHILADHGAFVLVPLGWASRLIPSPALLFLLQSAALASAVFPLSALAQFRSLSKRAKAASLTMLLLNPIVFNTAIFDFHPETLAFPLVMQALWWLERRAAGDERRVFAVLVLALTCKVGLALLVLGLGVCLFASGRRRIASALMALSVIWFAGVSSWVIPALGGNRAGLLRHADKFGLARADLAADGLAWFGALRPLLAQLLSWATAEYLLLLLLPVLYVLFCVNRRRFFSALLPFFPLLVVNMVAARPAMKDLVHHYSLFLVPFLAAAVQQTLMPVPAGLGSYPRWLQGRVAGLVIGWTLLMFLALSRIGFFFGPFQSHFGHLHAMRDAVAMVRADSALLVSNNFAPHLSHRQKLFILGSAELERLDQFDQILIDHRHPGFRESPSLQRKLKRALARLPSLRLVFDSDGIKLFQKQ